MGSNKDNIALSIITVTYKSWSTLRDLLVSLQQTNFHGIRIEIIVVNNYSIDKKHIEFTEQFPEITFIQNPKNSGFASGCNLGAQRAKGSHFLFLNPDTVSTTDAIPRMYAYLKNNPNCGIVSCLQKRPDGTFEKSKRYFPKLSTIFGFFRVLNSKSLERNIKETANKLHPDWVSGAVVCISRTWFAKIKGWNEDYWMYYEDIEFSKKIRDLGGEVILLKDTFIIHKHGVSSRINIKTTAITKTEVLISKHVYVHNNFSGFYRFFLQLIVLLYNIISKLIWGFLGLIFSFTVKGRLQVLLFANLIKYYIVSIFNTTWISKRSKNHPSKISVS